MIYVIIGFALREIQMFAILIERPRDSTCYPVPLIETHQRTTECLLDLQTITSLPVCFVSNCPTLMRKAWCSALKSRVQLNPLVGLLDPWFIASV